MSIFLFLCWVNPANAYVDPLSGSILGQLLFGGAAGAGVVLKLYWAQLRDFFSPSARRRAAIDAKPADEPHD